MQKILWFINNIINLIYPNVCGICEKISEDDLCKKCEIKLNNIAKFNIDTYKNKNFEKHLYIFNYKEIIKDRLVNFKFNDKIYIYKAFVKFITKNKKVYRFIENYDIIIPVPIHNKRKIQRGYNQSSLIANEIAKNNDNIKYIDDVLLKQKNNKPQSTKNKKERQENVIGAYNIKNEYKINNKKILLLDDIYTTGSTVNECAKILKENGAASVDIITIAKD